MRIHVAVLHAIGEDNEGNLSIVAKTREALVQKVLAFANEAYGDDPDDPPDARTAFHVEADLYDTYAISWDEHDLED